MLWDFDRVRQSLLGLATVGTAGLCGWLLSRTRPTIRISPDEVRWPLGFKPLRPEDVEYYFLAEALRHSGSADEAVAVAEAGLEAADETQASMSRILSKARILALQDLGDAEALAEAVRDLHAVAATWSLELQQRVHEWLSDSEFGPYTGRLEHFSGPAPEMDSAAIKARWRSHSSAEIIGKWISTCEGVIWRA